MIKSLLSHSFWKTKAGFLPVVFVFLISCFLFFTPGYDLPQVSDWFGKLSFDKVIHAGLFFALTLAALIPLHARFSTSDNNRKFLLTLILAVLWGVAVEIIQLKFISGRSFSFMDMIADAAGAFLAFFAGRKILNKTNLQ